VVKHIVLWRLKPEAHGRAAAENARAIKQKLEALRGRIPGRWRSRSGSISAGPTTPATWRSTPSSNRARR